LASLSQFEEDTVYGSLNGFVSRGVTGLPCIVGCLDD
jgi:hypothetical protein